MSKLAFSKLNLKKNIKTTSIIINDVEVEVKLELPIEDKESIIELVTQNSMEYNFINPLKSEKFFHLYFVMKCTNLSFTDKQREDESALYDLLEMNGVIDSVIGATPELYEDLISYCKSYIDKFEGYKNSMHGILGAIISDIPENMDQALKMLDGLDLSKVSETLQLVTLNGGNDSAIIETINGQK